MQHVVGMRDLKRVRDAREDVRHHVEREVAVVLAQEPLERRPFHVLHDEVRHGVFDLEVVHRDDVRVAELGDCPRFRETGDVGSEFVGRAQVFGSVFPGGNVLKANNLRWRRWRGIAFGPRMTGRLRLIGGRNPA